MYFPRSVLACNFCTEHVCASFRVFSLNFEGDKLLPWPFFKGQFQLQCGICAMAWPGSNPGDIRFIDI